MSSDDAAGQMVLHRIDNPAETVQLRPRPRVARRVNARIEERIKAGDPNFDEDDALATITFEDE
jgi:hypothetical protein